MFASLFERDDARPLAPLWSVATRAFPAAVSANPTEEQIASERQMKFVNRSFTVADMLNAKEVFVTSATSLVTPITKIDDTVIANGKMGSLSAALRADYLEKTSRVSANERNA